MDTRFLSCFVAVAEAGSIAEAARRLDLNEATLAQRLRALEGELECHLLTRVGRSVTATAVGNRVLPLAKVLLQQLQDLRAAASDTELPAGPLRLGAVPTGLTGILPPALKRWAELHPQHDVFIEPATSTALYERVRQAQLDAALIAHPPFALPKGCAWLPLRVEPLILLTRSDLPVPDVLKCLSEQPLIRYDRHVVAGRLADEYLRAHQLRVTVRLELDGIDAIAQMVAEGLGVAILPDWSAPQPPSPALKRWPLPPPPSGPVPSRTLGLLWQRHAAKAALAQAFGQVLRDLVRSERSGNDRH
jgi:DNA-binding transcriptional LysR family regulator